LLLLLLLILFGLSLGRILRQLRGYRRAKEITPNPVANNPSEATTTSHV